tara:strand:+ start:323 stop:1468 length:1146 start_codon:yes stop_codon:yes gene_type:complete
MSFNTNWNFPTSIKFGPDKINEIGEACRSIKSKNPLIVTDKNLRNLKITNNLILLLQKLNIQYSIFSEVDPNPNDENLNEGIEIFKKGQHDGIIAFGGGSALDLGKLIAFMANQSLSVWEFEDIGELWKKADENAIYPIIAIPTTAGTGSEVGRASVLTDRKKNIKKVIFHPRILPQQVICDPLLTLEMPKKITAGTGMDALAHCLEAYCSPTYHPMASGIAIEGIKLVKDNLIKAYIEGENVDARANMMSAALMGATSFQKGLGGIHALSHPIGAIFNTHHGTTNAVVMKNVLMFNKKEIISKINLLTKYLEIPNGFDGFIEFIETLCQKLNIPKNLNEIGVDKNQIELIASMAINDPTASGNPIKLNYQNTLDLLRKCF